MNAEIKKLTTKAAEHAKQTDALTAEIGKVIVGQEEIVKKLLIALIANGHVLVEGVPGLAKTLLIKTIAQTIGGSMQRIQFTPDLLPADIVGTKIYDHKSSSFTTRKGPIFANLILADEINRAPPKVQSALLEAMQERQVTIQGETFPLDRLFLVMATQNPIETEGTYKLPEAQVDRFALKLLIRYPTKKEEQEIVARTTKAISVIPKKIAAVAGIVSMQDFCRQIYADQKIEEYVTSIVDATRQSGDYGMSIQNYIEMGASPRASIWLTLCAKATAMMEGRGYVVPEDVKYVAHDVLRHRIIVSFEAEAEGISADQLITSVMENVKIP